MNAKRVTKVTVQGVAVAVLEDLQVGILRGNDDVDTFGPRYDSQFHRVLAIRPDSGDLMFVARDKGTNLWFLDGNDPRFYEHFDALERLGTA